MNDEEKKLVESINKGETETVLALLSSSRININCLDQDGATPLHHAAFRGFSHICSLLLSRGADVDSHLDHTHRYTPLMFAALSGNVPAVRCLLEACANPDILNSVNRTAAQLAGFVGHHSVVALISNWIPLSEFEYYTKIQGLEETPKLPPPLLHPLYQIANGPSLHPIRLALNLKVHTVLVQDAPRVIKVLELMCERNMKLKHDTRDPLALKLSVLASFIGSVHKFCLERSGTGSAEGEGAAAAAHTPSTTILASLPLERLFAHVDDWIKKYLRGRESDGFPEAQENLVRRAIRDFPFSRESELLKQLVKQIAPIPVGDDPTALQLLYAAINGQRFAAELDSEKKTCTTCGDFDAKKRCSACKMVAYCSTNCQKLHWFVHKKHCSRLSEEFVRFEAARERERQAQEKLAAEKASEAVQSPAPAADNDRDSTTTGQSFFVSSSDSSSDKNPSPDSH